jgi:hypothetical protein
LRALVPSTNAIVGIGAGYGTSAPHRLCLARLKSAVRREIIRRGRQKPCMRIVRLLFAQLTDPAAVIAHRAGGLERAALLLRDWLETHRRLLNTEHRMTAILDETAIDRVGHLDHRPAGDWRGGDPGPDRQPEQIRDTARALVNTPAWHHGRSCPAPSSAARN